MDMNNVKLKIRRSSWTMDSIHAKNKKESSSSMEKCGGRGSPYLAYLESTGVSIKWR
jgi:hypothetical protein